MAAARDWARALAAGDRRVRAVACFGSYARGDQGFGSDLDLVVLVEGQPPGPEDPRTWDTRGLPVPADVITYDLEQWQRLKGHNGAFFLMLEQEAVWLVGTAP